MSDSYEGLSTHYDLIMTSGYYDYDAYARTLLGLIGDRRRLLEIGAGTGLVCEKLLDLAPTGLEITGVDHTESMLDQARRRLGGRAEFVQADLRHLTLPSRFDAAYSVGGVWYFIHDDGDGGDGIDSDEPVLASHLLEEDDNITALSRVHAALKPDGLLALATQGPHRDHERPLPGGLVYSQKIRLAPDNTFTKDYYVRRAAGNRQGGAGEETVAHQRCEYRLYTMEQAERLLKQCGFRSEGVTSDGLFHYLTRQ
ncbi:class I SAM-dependent methyltransferase [Streptomyces varsoviensis]|uniref:class I SAM-dependent methyltransferase n=1 Tax=Streptomyces varsoviensis TaxID=67373 RepID=UPI0004C4E1FA|nr:class I SAM-dependent methyltransferase [Streptomyces varsoviensis]